MTTTLADATIVADAVLKTGPRSEAARAALQRAEIPRYALKEVRHGPFGNFVYAHNLLAETGSMRATRERVRRLGAQRHKQQTAQEALDEAEAEVQGQPMAQIVAQLLDATATHLGSGGVSDAAFARQYRVALRGIVQRAHAEITVLMARATGQLPCFESRPLVARSGDILDDGVRKCGSACALGALFASRSADVSLLAGVVTQQSQKPENTKRAAALQFVATHPGAAPSSDQCRALGDAVYALLCPAGGTIITTNVVDHAPLAEALGKRAKAP